MCIRDRDDWVDTISQSINQGFDTVTSYDMIEVYGGGTASFKLEPNDNTNERYRQFYDRWYQMMWECGYIVRYGSNNAIKRTKLDSYLQNKDVDIDSITRQKYLDLASQYAVSRYYHNRLSASDYFVGFGVGASSRLYNEMGADTWLFNHPATDGWLNNPAAKDVYSFPPEIWMCKDIRHWLANTGSIDATKFRNKYSVDLHGVFQDEIVWLLKNNIMHWSENRLCVTIGRYDCMPHIRALFTPTNYLKDLLRMLDDKEFLKSMRKRRSDYDRGLIAS